MQLNTDILNENLVQSAQTLRPQAESSPSNMTITLRTQPRQCRSGLWTTLWTSSSGPARAGTWNQSDIFGETYKWLSTDGPQTTWQSLRWSKEKNGKKTKQMQMCKACCIIPKKTWGCNCCQSALSFELRVWRLVQWHFFSVSFLINLQSCDQSVFCFVIMVSGV